MKQIITFFIFLQLSLFSLSAKTIIVCSSCEVSSVSEAVSIAAKGDTILIKKGVYNEQEITIDKTLTIIGEDYPIIDAQSKSKLFTVIADSVTIKGLNIKNISPSYTEDLSAIRIKKQSFFHIEDNILENIFFGIYIEGCKGGIIKNNRVTAEAVDEFNSGNAIHLWHSKNIKILNNHVEGARDGIYLEFVDSTIVRGNTSKHNIRYGLHFMFSNDDEYRDNTFENNGAGVAVMYSKRIIMIGNTFKKNWGSASYGLLLKEIYDGEIFNNTFQENTIGINADGSNRINIVNNNFIQNGWAIKVLGGCYYNKFNKNNFLNNTFDLSYKGSMNDNNFNGNHWSTYAGYDLDKDGIGDVPYRPVKLFSYIVNMVPESIVLLRSLFVDLIDFSERVSPVFTPDNLLDEQPLMKAIKID
ncbi:MAG: nitrous oxide reductase family maturation protein NosD [Flavobacteriales bacterium]|nr:nitrous oxide reductase family maturation protein NosD [Flavobacteriales bacterium]